MLVIELKIPKVIPVRSVLESCIYHIVLRVEVLCIVLLAIFYVTFMNYCVAATLTTFKEQNCKLKKMKSIQPQNVPIETLFNVCKLLFYNQVE